MERKIIFIVWDSEKKEFFVPIHDASNGRLVELFITPRTGELCRRGLTIFEHESVFENRYKLSQYTGMQDKKGLEIYEGDILKYIFEWETYHPASEDVTYNSVTKHREVIFKTGAFRMKGEIGILAEARDWNVEIIGNIYENSEILTITNNQ